MEAVLRINCSEIRRRLKEAGLDVCPCCEFEESVWLCVTDKVGNIHGEGYAYEGMEDWPIEDILDLIEKERHSDRFIDCRWDVKKFIEIALKIKNGESFN